MRVDDPELVARDYVAATIRGAELAPNAEGLDVPFRARSNQAVFIADTAS